MIKSRFLKRIAVLSITGVLVFLSGCAVLTVDVDVYKGPLADHADVQTEQLAAMAVGVEPILEWLEHILKVQCKNAINDNDVCTDWVKLNEALNNVKVTNDGILNVYKGTITTNSGNDIKVRNGKLKADLHELTGEKGKLTLEEGRLVTGNNGSLNIKKGSLRINSGSLKAKGGIINLNNASFNVSNSDVNTLANLRTLQILDSVYAVRTLYRDLGEVDPSSSLSSLLKDSEQFVILVKENVQILDGNNEYFTPDNSVVNRLRELVAVNGNNDADPNLSCLAQAYLQFLVPKEKDEDTHWRDEDAIFSVAIKMPTINKNIKQFVQLANPKIHYSENARHHLRPQCLDLGKYMSVPGNWAFQKLSDGNFQEQQATVLFGDDKGLKDKFKGNLETLANSYIQSREATEKIFLNILEILKLMNGITFDDQYVKNIDNQYTKRHLIFELSNLLVYHMINQRSLDDTLEKGWCEEAQCRSLLEYLSNLRDRHNPDKINKEKLRDWIIQDPEQAADALIAIHDHQKTTGLNEVEKARRAHGLTALPGSAGVATQDTLDTINDFSRSTYRLSKNIHPLVRGRIEKGLFTLIEEYLEESDKRHPVGCNRDDCGPKAVARSRLLDALARFSRKLLVLADHQPLFLENHMDKGLRREIDRFTRILQAVGNALRIQVNDLRSREANNVKLRALGPSQIEAFKSVFNNEPELVNKRLLAMLGSDLDALKKKLSKLPEKPEPKPAIAESRLFDINVTDPDSKNPKIIKVEGTSGLSIVDNKIKLDVLASDKGVKTITYEVEDDTGLKATGKILAGINVDSKLPVVPDTEKETDEDKKIAWTVARGLPDNSQIKLFDAKAQYGTVGISADKTQLNYMPKTDFSGDDKVEYSLSDEKEFLYKGTTTIHVKEDNTDGPEVQKNIYIHFNKGGKETVSLVGYVTDPDKGEKLEFTKINPEEGEEILNKGTSITSEGALTYTPTNIGGEVVKFRVTDKTGNSAVGILYIWVGDEKKLDQFNVINEPNEEDKTLVISKQTLTQDKVSDGIILNIKAESGTVIENKDGNFEFTPARDTKNKVSLSYVIYELEKKNNSLLCKLICSDDNSKAPYLVDKAVIPVKTHNDPPVVMNQSYVIKPGVINTVDSSTKERSDLEAQVKIYEELIKYIKDNKARIIAKLEGISGSTDMSNVLSDILAEDVNKTSEEKLKKSYVKYQQLLAEKDYPVELHNVFMDTKNPDKSPDIVQVIDELLTILRARRIQAAAELGDEANTRAERALLEAYRQRTDLLYIRPALAYLQSAFTASNLMDNHLAWRNLLSEHGKRAWLGRWAVTNSTDKLAMKITESIDVQYWHPINQVRVAGGGNTNYVIAKDDVGNWYVKGYSNDMKSVINSARSLAAFTYSGGGIAPALDQDKLKAGEVAFRTDQGLPGKHEQFRKKYIEQLTAILEKMHDDSSKIEENLKSSIKLEDEGDKLKDAFKANTLIDSVKMPDITEKNPLRATMVADRIDEYWKYYVRVKGGIDSVKAPTPDDKSQAEKQKEEFNVQRKAAQKTAWNLIVDSSIQNYFSDLKNAVNQYKTAIEIIGQLDN